MLSGFGWGVLRYDPGRPLGQTSVGLGGNISGSLHVLEDLVRRLPPGSHVQIVPPIYESPRDDAGNGSAKTFTLYPTL